jgi:hypothetical protein
MFVVPEADQTERFEFEWRGEQYSFPKMANVTFDQISLLGDLADLASLRTLFEAVSPEFAEKALGRMSTTEIGALVEGWQVDSGVSLGESEASTTS